jgi:thioredoxin reductase (NADPH)
LRQIVNRCPEVGDVILQAFIARRQLLRESGEFTGIRVIGSRYSHDTFRIRDFLARNRALFTFLDLESNPEVEQLLRRFGLTVKDTPVVAWGTKLVLRNPSNREIAEALGLRRPLEQTVYDLAIVGGGPGGLAASVYGASEGLSTVVLERTAPGGQAGASMRIENYLGFPTGVTGGELAERAIVQANKFGAILSVATPVVSLTFDNAYSVLALEGGETVIAKCLLIATGAEYRRLDVGGCAQFEGSGVYYAATPNEVQLCQGANVVIVGGGNSAGQAAVYLSRYARKVYLLIRGNDLYKSMSAYLAHRIEQTPNIEVLLNTTVQRMSGDGHLASVEIVNKETGETRKLETPAVFSFIGATPLTDWLPSEIERDEKKFVRTGPTMSQSRQWNLRRQPFLLETSRPGVFAAGDVRSGSVKRVASAVGEGAMAVQFVHEYLKEM